MTLHGAGVNLAGYLRTESGVGAAARGYAAALRHLGVPISLADLSHLSGNRAQDQTLTDFDRRHPYPINLVCADIEPHFAVVSDLGPAFFEGRYNVGIWAWELPRFPEKWADRFAYYDEIWVGSSFIANALAPVSPLPVVRIPPALDTAPEGSRERGRRHIRACEDEFVFLFIFDAHSHLERKNPLAVVEAFRQAFLPSEAVRLVLKTVNAHSARAGLAQLQARAEGYPVSVCDGYWPATDVGDLVAACDVYVSLHRSEGTGLTITDAMAAGKPVIATGWSGNMDFMTVSNSYPVRYELVEIESRVGPYPAGDTWAEPSVDHAAALMRSVFEDRDAARERGRLARRDVAGQYSSAHIAELVAQRLRAIHIRQDMAVYRQRMWDRFHEYQALGARVRAAVKQAVPAGATAAVVSRGDDHLVQLDGRVGWHFPQTPDGVYAGAHPADSLEAIAQLTSIRARGAEYLVIPSTASWWLDFYGEFGEHLNRHHRQIASTDACRIYALEGGRT